MIDHGANPHVIGSDGRTEYETWNLSSLVNVPTVKSIWFSVDNWTYTSGVYPGDFGDKIGSGGEGTVIEGKWDGEPAAFKFVQIEQDSTLRPNSVEGGLIDLKKRLNEMEQLKSIKSPTIINFFGHYV